ncbi:hypothetical protein [Clostridium baratii]|uniref:hypothetical protein n=1 Tax=Clostridium baratii TaxID=1561 RepID=UPI0030D3D50E
MLKKIIVYLVIFINTVITLLLSLGKINTLISVYDNIKYSLILIVIAIVLLSIIFFAINYTKYLKIDLKRYFKFIGLNFYSLSIFFILYNIFFYSYSIDVGREASIFVIINIIIILVISLMENKE